MQLTIMDIILIISAISMIFYGVAENQLTSNIHIMIILIFGFAVGRISKKFL